MGRHNEIWPGVIVNVTSCYTCRTAQAIIFSLIKRAVALACEYPNATIVIVVISLYYHEILLAIAIEIRDRNSLRRRSRWIHARQTEFNRPRLNLKQTWQDRYDDNAEAAPTNLT